jgi:hypothetical protein
MMIFLMAFSSSFMPSRISAMKDIRRAQITLQAGRRVLQSTFTSSQAQSFQVTIPTGSELTNSASQETESLDISRLLDKADDEYDPWHQLRVGSELFREDIQKARDVVLEYCLGLKQIHEDI